MSGRDRTRHWRRRSVAVLSFVVALLIIGSFALWLFQLSATTAMSSLGHYYSTGAFYAAEGGIEMALRELSQGNDFDSDGGTGTISNNGNDADDPRVATGAVHVEKTGASPPLYQATGMPVQATAPWSTFRRTVEVETQ